MLYFKIALSIYVSFSNCIVYICFIFKLHCLYMFHFQLHCLDLFCFLIACLDMFRFQMYCLDMSHFQIPMSRYVIFSNSIV